MRQVVMAVLVSAAMLFSSGCVSEPEMDKGKFSELDRTARELQASLATGNPCDVPDALLQKLVSGTAALQDTTASKEERDLSAAYSSLLTIYKDGLLLCTYRTHLSQFSFVPPGRIYVFQELDPIVEKYDLPTRKHLYQPTGLHWRSIDGDSIKVIWERAALQIKNIENMVRDN